MRKDSSLPLQILYLLFELVRIWMICLLSSRFVLRLP